MANLTITNVDMGSVVLKDGEFRDEVLIFAGVATALEGTILARVTASGKLTPFVVGGSGGAEIPKGVLTYAVTSTGAGDVPIRNMVSGSVRAGRLIINADGDNSNVTAAVLDQLRDYSLISINVQELNILDNQ
jgi:hypothetical protein